MVKKSNGKRKGIATSPGLDGAKDLADMPLLKGDGVGGDGTDGQGEKKYRHNVPSIGDSLLMDMDREGAEIIREIWKVPEELGDVIARTQLSEDEIKCYGRLFSKWFFLEKGDPNLPWVVWFQMGCRISLDRQGRREMIQAYARKDDEEPRRGFFGKLGDKFSGRRGVAT